MKKYRQVDITKIYEEDGHEQESIRETLHTIKSWDELTDEEKEEEIDRHKEDIYMRYQDDLYEEYKMELDNLRYEFKNISFDEVYLDSNSQGGWIDSIKGFKINDEGINIYGENLWVDSVDFTIRRYIEDFDIIVDDYYVDADKMTRIMETKKYKNWLDGIKNDIQKWVDRVNESSKYILTREYCYPYNIHDDEDKEWLDMYFEDMDFESVETLHEDNVC
jgi:hypothetical protein